MTVVASYLYRDGKRIEAVPIDRAVPPEDENTFIWIGLHEPTLEEMTTLKHNFQLHPLAIEDSLNPAQSPKVDIYDSQLFVAAKTAHRVGERIEYGVTAIFIGRNHIISVRHGSDRGHSKLRSQLEATPQTLRHGPDYVLHAILDFIVDGYLPIVQSIEDEMLDMEQQMLDAFLERDQITRIFRTRREVIRFLRVIGPMVELCGKLVHLDLPCLDPEAKPYFRDVLDHAMRAEMTIAGLRDVITSVFEASNLLEQQRQGVITRQLASWAAILAVPTAIAGIYGMNFENMPELKTTYGYFVVLGVIVLLCFVLYLRFKKARWL
ncbi:MAG: magnesium transporter [Rhizobium sp. 63-7]|nr:MAG: magnesium transporter [Rhizobium sp. 63-7]